MGPDSDTTRRRTSRRTTVGTRKRKASADRGRVPLARRVFRWLAAIVAASILATVVLVLPWRWFAPPTSAFMLRERWARDTTVHYRWVSWEAISPHLAMAVVAAEDQKFPNHFGFDFQSILDAIEETGGPRRGASTISQQVAKNLFLWPGRSYLRKGVEAYLTVLIEGLWPKRRILEVYLNVAEFGPGVFGAEAAGRRFFDKPARRLSLREASLLAAVLPSPSRMSAGRPSAYVRKRAAEIRGWVRKLGGVGYLKAM